MGDIGDLFRQINRATIGEGCFYLTSIILLDRSSMRLLYPILQLTLVHFNNGLDTLVTLTVGERMGEVAQGVSANIALQPGTVI